MGAFGLYVVVAAAVVVAVFVLTERYGADEASAPKAAAFWVITAGLVWPVLVIGAAQGGLLYGLCLAWGSQSAHRMTD